jgi:hypothetical protein
MMFAKTTPEGPGIEVEVPQWATRHGGRPLDRQTIAYVSLMGVCQPKIDYRFRILNAIFVTMTDTVIRNIQELQNRLTGMVEHVVQEVFEEPGPCYYTGNSAQS